MKQVIIVFAALFLMSGSCFDDGCQDCETAIDHMAGKISNYSCDPNNMAEAWKKITNSCEEDGDVYVGIMAESCANGELIIPDCTAGTKSLNGISIDLENNTTETVEFTLKSVINSFTEKWKAVNANSTETIQFDDFIYEGASFHISIENSSTEELLVEGEIDLTFNRHESNSWTYNRIIGVTPTTEGYAMNFFNWN